MMWLPLVVKCSSALQTQRWFLKAYIVRSKGCQGLAGWWSAPGKARAKVCMCPGQQPRPGHGGQRVRHRPLKAGQSLCLSHLILPRFFRVAFVYVRLLYYYALEFGATITVLNLCDLFSGKTLHLFVVLGCGELCIEPVCWSRLCGCDTAAFVEALVRIPGPSILSLHQTFAVMAVRHRLTLESRRLGHAHFLPQQSAGNKLGWKGWTNSSSSPDRDPLAAILFGSFAMVGLSVGEGESKISGFQE
jgi:hypothetical protein